MRPLTVITGILLGSCLSISLSLAAVMIIFLVLGDDYPRLAHEFRGLTSSLLIFTGMTAICAVSFYLIVYDRPGRWLAQTGMWASVAATGYYYWPQ